MGRFRIIKTKQRIFSFLIYIVLFLSSLYPYADYDWGWHVKYGEYLIQTGNVLRTNIFSRTMPNYQWVNTSWLFDPIAYLLYHYANFLGLSISAAIISVYIFYILVKPFSLQYWQKGLLALCFVLFSVGLVWEGLRSQLLGAASLATLITVIWYIEQRNAFLYILPLLFLLWANVHGSFILGLVVLSVYIGIKGVYGFKCRNFLNPNYKKLVIISLLSAFLTLVNPFTYHVYTEVLKHWHNPLLTNIIEWTPIAFSPKCITCHLFIVYVLVFIGGAAWMLLTTPSVMYVFYSVCGMIFFYATISARRYLGLFAIMTVPLMAMLTLRISQVLPIRVKYGTTIFIMCLTVVFWKLAITIPAYHLFSNSFDMYCLYSSLCSEKTAEYLIGNPPAGNGMNYYGWGGFLIGKGVPVKTFIDGRMPIWSTGNIHPYSDYIQMYYSGDMQQFASYNFSWVLIEKNSVLSQKLLSPLHEYGNWLVTFADGNTLYIVKKL